MIIYCEVLGGRLIKQECCSIPGFLSMRVQERGLVQYIHSIIICIHLVRILSSGGGGGGGGGGGQVRSFPHKNFSLQIFLLIRTLCNSLNH